MKTGSKNTTRIAIIGGAIVLVILLIGTFWMARAGKKDTENAVRSVSLLYLDELASRREQVVESNLQESITNIDVAIGLMGENDLSDIEHLQAYQARIKKLYDLEKFAFVDTDGLIYTSLGTQDNIDDYDFDYKTISGPEISILNPEDADKKVIIAVPVSRKLGDKDLVVCFEEIDMDTMLAGVSMTADTSTQTFCNIYTKDGIALTDVVLGGLASEDNLLVALEQADYEEGYSSEKVRNDFAEGNSGEVSFTYNGIKETLSYAAVEGTDWLLTYLIRESVITDKISSITNGVILRSVLQAVLTIIALVIMFIIILRQNRKNAQIMMERETAETENRVKQQELEEKLALQEELLEHEKRRAQQEKLITALSSDYWSVYYLELDKDEGVCYQSHSDVENGFKVGERFPYLASVTAYANRYVTEPYREEFLKFIQPDAVREGLKEHDVISYRYMVHRHDQDVYEMVRFATVRRPDDDGDDERRFEIVGACFANVDRETREALEQRQILSDALKTAEQANIAKTKFLSNMSHEIRTPMNAIIGLDNIAMNDPETPEKTREYLQKIDASAEHLLHLINDILDMSRVESGRLVLKKEEFSFQKLLEAINTMFSSQCADKGLEYHCYMKGQVADYYIGDNMKLRQVLINILGNAVKFTPEGGRVEFDVERTAQYDDQSTLQFTIKDNGIGMSEEFLPHIFDTFAQEDSSTTNKYGSSGLGMAITKNIVELMNGNIRVESKKGEGSTFVVTVTLMNSDRKGNEGNEEIRPQDMSVLIVDDDPIACEHAQLVLEKAGISSEIAASGAQAIEMVRLRHARRDPYNLILVDWQMPEMDGVEATRQIRSIVGNDSAIIILTAYRWDDILEEALEAGVDSFLAKPLFAATVIEEFKEAFKKKNVDITVLKNKAELKGRRVLLAEDVEINAEIMVMILTSKEIESELAVNGKIAVDMFAEHEPGYYDAVLMDMRMPEMDGLEATRTIRAMDREDAKKIPIIALTANAFDEDVQRSLQAGLNAHLSKPVQPEALFETLESLIQD